MAAERIAVRDFFARLRWLDGAPLLDRIEPYRLTLFERFFALDHEARPTYNLGLFGRGKKNWKSADLVLACFVALLTDSPGGNQIYIVANDEDQAGDDLEIAKKLLRSNPRLEGLALVRRNVIERKDGEGFIEILPAKDATGQHGKTFRLLAIDEVHGHRTWDLLEALAPDPTRHDTQTWITSYASLFHRPGVPLFDLLTLGRAGTDPRMLLSWYGGDFTTDPDFADATPEQRANPSMASWGHPEYLAQQRRRLPSHKYRRLHLNLPGLPEGSPFQPEPVSDAIARGVPYLAPASDVAYVAFVDMSGGSADDAVLGIGHRHGTRLIVDRLVHQGQPAPFDPRRAVERFAIVLHEYGVRHVTGDAYGGQTFRCDFEGLGIRYDVAKDSTSALYEALEPKLNAREVQLPDVPLLEQQLLGLIWRGGKITHPSGEHDDWVTAAAGVVNELAPVGDRSGGGMAPLLGI